MTNKCFNCDHKINNKTDLSNNKCIYCLNRKLCDDENCNKCFTKSFASTQKAKLWSNKNKMSPRNVFKSSHKKYVFDCDKCNHEYKTTTVGKCFYCKNKILCDDKNCSTCFERSLASTQKAKLWSKNNKISP